MAGEKALFISGSVGLGHVTRDLAIARELREQNPEIEIRWLACQPASTLIEDAGEKLLPESSQWANDNIPIEKCATEGFRLNLLKYLTSARGAWGQNAEIFEQVANREAFDIIIADEAYEISLALRKDRDRIKAPFVMIYDFIGCDAMSRNPIEKFLTYMWNRKWATNPTFYADKRNTALFVGELEDVPDKGLGLFLPNRRVMAKDTWQFIGYILRFDPSEYADSAEIKVRLGYDENPLVVCSVGGTAVGKDLLTLCGRAYPIAREKIPNLQMVLVCGPRLSPDSLNIPAGVEALGYVPALFEHFAASDLAIVQAGGSTTIELTALKRPFFYFPLEEHFEQQIDVAGRLTRHQAGIKMQYSQTTPETLAEMIVSNIGKEVKYPAIPTDGAKKAAEIINRFL
jgi:UDP-N-acetylglucosamine:LPS N-acetylglucosamine transferase